MIGGLRGIIAEGEVLTKQCYLSREWDVWFHKLKELEKEITSSRQNSLRNVEFYKKVKGMDTLDEEWERYYQLSLAEILDGSEVGKCASCDWLRIGVLGSWGCTHIDIEGRYRKIPDRGATPDWCPVEEAKE